MKPPATMHTVESRFVAYVAAGRPVTAAHWVHLMKASCAVPLEHALGRFRAVTFDVKGGEPVIERSWELVGDGR